MKLKLLLPRTAKQTHIRKYFDNARSRAIKNNLEFDITPEYLETIATDVCPIFNESFEWGSAKLGKGKQNLTTPNLDRIIPELGYVQGNVAFISVKANRIKSNGTMEDHYKIADWIWSKTRANKS